MTPHDKKYETITTGIPPFRNLVTADFNILRREWPIYLSAVQAMRDIPEEFDLANFWQSMSRDIPFVSAVASEVVWIPPSSAFVERAFSKYRKVLSDERQNLSENSLRTLTALYINGVDPKL
jgi:hypothetical protein